MFCVNPCENTTVSTSPAPPVVQIFRIHSIVQMLKCSPMFLVQSLLEPLSIQLLVLYCSPKLVEEYSFRKWSSYSTTSIRKDHHKVRKRNDKGRVCRWKDDRTKVPEWRYRTRFPRWKSKSKNSPFEVTKISFKTVYFYAENGATQTKNADSSSIIEFATGQKEISHADGTKEIVFPDRVREIISISGRKETIHTDGVRKILEVNGDEIVLFPDGQKVKSDVFKSHKMSRDVCIGTSSVPF